MPVSRCSVRDLDGAGPRKLVYRMQGGEFAGTAGLEAHSATKFALDGLSETLAAEVLIVEPGSRGTDFDD
jgi:NAD(P)-dependent dehydrogenase (short-subunit alcohol dehydrogenase family)